MVPRSASSVTGLAASPPHDVADAWVPRAEARLGKLVVQSAAPSAADAPPFPLPRASSSQLEQDMMDELAASWDAHTRLPSLSVAAHHSENGCASLRQLFARELQETSDMRAALEATLLAAVGGEGVPTAASGLEWATQGWRLRAASGRVPTTTPRDLARLLTAPDAAIRRFSLFLGLSVADCTRFRSGVRSWMALCVLEDKLRRLVAMAGAAASSATRAESAADVEMIVKELAVS